MKGKIFPYNLAFKKPAGTSRGVLREKLVYYLLLQDEQGKSGIGECAVFPGLSAEYGPDFEMHLNRSMEDWNSGNFEMKDWKAFSSIMMAWETALNDLASPLPFRIFNSSFCDGKEIPINGLIWMDSQEIMRQQIKEKLAQGFSCIKMKIGAIHWEEEHELLQGIRSEFSADEVEIRVDANGAFNPGNVMKLMDQLAALKIHSIEQPIKQGQLEAMRKICAASPVPIALDEELIGVNDALEKARLLDLINPPYLILKPSLVGGFSGSDEWIALAEERNIAWWATSALESNVGLNAISQWVSSKNNPLPQGLGTGALFTNNIPSPLEVSKGKLSYKKDVSWEIPFKYE